MEDQDPNPWENVLIFALLLLYLVLSIIAAAIVRPYL